MENLIGTLLKAKREEKNISLEEVSKKTKININILKHLEASEMDKLPNKTYVRGFVKNVAKTIGLEASEAMESLDHSYQRFYGEEKSEALTQTNLGSLQEDNPMAEESEEIKETFVSILQSFFNKKIFYSVIAIAVLFVLGKGVVNFFSQLNYESKSIGKVKEEKPKENLKPEDSDLFNMSSNKKFATEIVAEQLLEEERAKQAKQAEEEAKAAAAKKAAEEAAKAEVARDGKFPFRRFSNVPEQTFEVLANAPENKNTDLLPSNIKTALVDGKQNVYILAMDDDTWIAYKVDDEPIKKYVLKKGRRVLIQGDVIRLFMGNYNVTKIFYNNQLISAQTRTGVKSLVFPAEAGKDFQLPLFPTFKGKAYTSSEYQARMMDKENI